jgi:cell division septation protein DedD
MNKFLLHILHEINTIIIPGLGALTVTNSSTGEIMFMSFLKHDDGNLAKYISEKEGVSENDAKNLIAKYVREMLAKLDKGEDYDMYKFGRFKKINGEIEFENWDKYNSSDETSENVIAIKVNMENSEKIEEISKKFENKIESEQEAIEEKSKSIDAILEPKIETEKIVIIEEKIEEIPTPIKTEEIKKEEIYEIVEASVIEEKVDQEEIEIKTTSNTKKNPSIKSQKSDQNTEKKKRGLGFWLLILLIVILAGSITTGIFIDEIKIAFSSQKIKNEISIENDSSNDVILEKIEEQVEIKDETDQNPENENVKKVENNDTKFEPKTTNGLAFHIIAGGFSSEQNANNLAKKFQSEGKNASVLGKFDELFLVAYESFSTKEEAQNAMKNSEIKGWIFKYQK